MSVTDGVVGAVQIVQARWDTYSHAAAVESDHWSTSLLFDLEVPKDDGTAELAPGLAAIKMI